MTNYNNNNNTNKELFPIASLPQLYKNKKVAKRNNGAPKFSRQLCSNILTDIATSGKSVQAICENNEIEWSTWYLWVNLDDSLSQAYARAREIGAKARLSNQMGRIDQLDNMLTDDKYDHHQRNTAVRIEHLRMDATKYQLSIDNPAYDKNNKNIINQSLTMNMGDVREDAWDKRRQFMEDTPAADVVDDGDDVIGSTPNGADT